jgi:hypothetical protein
MCRLTRTRMSLCVHFPIDAARLVTASQCASCPCGRRAVSFSSPNHQPAFQLHKSSWHRRMMVARGRRAALLSRDMTCRGRRGAPGRFISCPQCPQAATAASQLRWPPPGLVVETYTRLRDLAHTPLLLRSIEAENRLIGHPAPPQDECLTGWDVAPGMRRTIPPPPPPPATGRCPRRGPPQPARCRGSARVFVAEW